jgi:single-stranded-DNA-specific exonuclease
VLIERREPHHADALPDNLPPLLRRIYRNRGVTTAEELDLALAGLLGTERLGGLAAAIDLLVEALERQQRILIVGDFDADGATSTALAIRALRAMGAGDLQFLVPNRFDFGYGLTPALVEVAAGYDPWLVITVDNGISSLDGVAAAREKGMRVLVTDHHLPPEQLPRADAIVNPNLQGDQFPSKHLAGVGVIFYVMAALRARLRETDWFGRRHIDEPNLAEYLDLVALGTVADVVPLDRNNRILVQNGLQRIRSGRCCAGVRALLEAARRNLPVVTAMDLGFFAGPRLNAAGRLEDMSLGIACLLTDDEREARELAAELDALNRQRREIESDMKQQALGMLDSLQLSQESIPAGICLYEPEWHQGVVGIVASRVREEYHRPVIVFAAEDETMLKGSGRSIPGVHIRDLLEHVSTQNPGMIRKFGGHAMAAGLSLPLAQLDAFRKEFDRFVRMQVDEEQLRGQILTDGGLSEAELSLRHALLLREAGPWGQAFPEPLFDDHFLVVSQRVVGDNHLKLVVSPERNPGMRLDAIAFNQADRHNLGKGQIIHAAYRLDINDYMGTQRLQLIVLAIVE